MKKFLQLSAVCLFAVSSLVVTGCGEAEKKPMDKTTAETPADGDAETAKTDGSEAKKGSDSK